MEFDPRRDYSRYMWAPYTQMGDLAEDEPVVAVGGSGARITDSLGREFIDGHAALWLANVGFGRSEIVDAAEEQMRRLSWFPSFGGMSNDTAIRLAARLIGLTEGEGMSRVFFSSGGSEANETALKIARQYWKLRGHQGKFKVIAREKAYHGVTFGALSATGVTANRRLFEPLVPGFRHIPPPHCYRCPYGLKYPECNLACAEELERTIAFESPDTVAAFIAEPVMGAGGVIIPPEGYLERVAEICRRNEVLFIADEVITGFGRTGEMFGVRHWGVKPDMMVFAKGLTSGYLPLGATLTTEEIFEVCLGRWGEGRELRHGTTYSGHPAACAAALENIRIIEEEGLAERSREMGEYMLRKLEELRSLRHVGDVAGIGLLARLELVKDKETREPFPPGELTGLRVNRSMLRRGVILRPLGDVMSFSPPLVIERDEIDRIVSALAESIGEI